LAQHDDVESAVRVGFEIAIGIALNDRQAVANARIDARLAQLDAAPINALVTCQIGKQRAIAATNVKDARLRLDHVGNQPEIPA
jgi:chemotaxis regulatin CheY-phosphate phosphatase CheZ